MSVDEAVLLLEHTGYDDFNLLEHQIKGRLEAIQVILKENQKYKELIDKAIKYYESNQQECVIGRNKDEKLIKEYYLPAQCSKKMLDILKEVE